MQKVVGSSPIIRFEETTVRSLIAPVEREMRLRMDARRRLVDDPPRLSLRRASE
jgi:hypothetical protein